MKTKLTLLLLLILTSCSSTQKTKSKSVEEIKTESLVQIGDKTEITENKENNTLTTKKTETNEETGEVIETETVEPMDNSKPATTTDENGKTQTLNNAKKTKSKTTRKSKKAIKDSVVINNSEKVAKNEQKDVKTVVEAKVEKRNLEANKIVKRDPTKQIIVISVLIVGAIVFLAWWFFGIGKTKKGSVPKMENPPSPPSFDA